MSTLKKYLISQYGLYISKIKISKCWLNVELTNELRGDKEKYVKTQADIRKACELLWDYPSNICVG